MPQYDNTNKGIIYTNDRKEKEEQPDYKGFINIEGKDYWLSGWRKKNDKLGNFLSLAVTPKEPGVRPAGGAEAPPDTDDDVPF